MRPSPRTSRLVGLAVVVAAVVVTLSGCSLPSFGAPDAASEQGRSILSLWRGFFLAALGVGALVWGLLVYVLVRFRRRRRADGTEGAEDEIPHQRAYNIPVEIAYTALPILAVAVLFTFSVVTEEKVTDLEDDPAVEVDVIGFQWSWQFAYPDEDIVVTGGPGVPPELVLPVDQAAQLNLVPTDVAHSFWVPDFLSKRDLIPGVENTIEVTPTKLGSYDGRCAEFCGLDHWQMYFSVRVIPEADYREWVDQQREAQRA